MKVGELARIISTMNHDMEVRVLFHRETDYDMTMDVRKAEIRTGSTPTLALHCFQEPAATFHDSISPDQIQVEP